MTNPFKIVKDFLENRKLNKEVLSLKKKRNFLNRREDDPDYIKHKEKYTVKINIK